MNLEERTNQLFVELMTNPQITSKELCQKFELTRGQLNYALQKINSSLEEEKLTPIKRTKNGHFIISSEVFSYVKGGEPAKNDLSSGYVFSSDERVDLIQLRLLSKDEYLSLNHFIDELEVSRNTVLRDLKEVDQRIEPYSLKLVYSRKDGYYIQGDEWDKRKLLSDLLITVGQNYHGIDLISKYANIEPNAIETMKKRVELVEQDLDVQFTDEWLKILPLLLILLIRRAQKGRLISYSFKINEAELSDTKEYLAADRVIWDVERLTENERVYLTMVLLTANLSRANILSATEISNMKAALEAVIEKFGKIVGIQLKNKEVLLNRLLVHMRPAYYRIKYHLNLQTKYFQENTDKDLSSLFYLVKKASGPLTNFFKEPLPDAELFMISLFIGSHMVGTSDIVSEDNRIKAIIVCPNGISIATMLEHSLRKLLPEVNFVAVISAREFYKNTYDADYVFSAVPLKTDKQVFVVNSFLTAEEKKQLRQKFLRTTYTGQTNKVTPENILEVIEKHTTIKDEGALYEDVLALFNPKESVILSTKKNGLTDMLTEKNIMMIENITDWHRVLDMLAAPLKETHIITPNYVEAVKQEMAVLPDYVVLRNKIALPHTVAEAGALGVGITLAVVKKGIVTKSGQRIHTIIFLASNNKEEHIDLILEIMDLAGSTAVDQLEEATDKPKMLEIIRKFSDTRWRH